VNCRNLGFSTRASQLISRRLPGKNSKSPAVFRTSLASLALAFSENRPLCALVPALPFSLCPSSQLSVLALSLLGRFRPQHSTFEPCPWRRRVSDVSLTPVPHFLVSATLEFVGVVISVGFLLNFFSCHWWSFFMMLISEFGFYFTF